MKRHRKKLVRAAIVLLSLLACGAIGWVWGHSYGAEQDRISFRWAGVRYTLHSDHGRLYLLKPPGLKASEAVRKRFADLTNDDVSWVSAETDSRYNIAVAPQASRMLWELDSLPSDEAVPALLDALEKPERYVIAHVLLVWYAGGKATLGRAFNEHGQTLQGTWAGLRVELSPTGGSRVEAPGVRTYKGEPAVHIDPRQRSQIRDYWNNQFAVPVASLHYRWPALATALPAVLVVMAFARRSFRRRRRQRRGQCPECGYDLRGSASDRCSECGTPIDEAMA